MNSELIKLKERLEQIKQEQRELSKKMHSGLTQEEFRHSLELAKERNEIEEKMKKIRMERKNKNKKKSGSSDSKQVSDDGAYRYVKVGDELRPTGKENNPQEDIVTSDRVITGKAIKEYGQMDKYGQIKPYRQIIKTEQPKVPEPVGPVEPTSPQQPTQQDDKTDKYTKSWATVGKICVAVLGGVVMIYAIKGCSKDNSNTVEPTPTPAPTPIEDIVTEEPVPTEVPVEMEIPNKLMEKGYSEYAANKMAQNFSDEAIEAILNGFYRQEIENYVEVKEFVYDYLDKYEETRVIYNVSAEKAVDYVNRAYVLNDVNFLSEGFDKTVEIIEAIDSGDLYTDDKISSLDNVYNTMNEITDNYRFNTTTELDIKKIEKLPYLATDGSDLRVFYNKFSELATNILNNPYDTENKKTLLDFLAIYTLCPNNFDTNFPAENNDEFLKDYMFNLDNYYNEEFRNAAAIDNTYFYNVAYETVVSSLGFPISKASVNDPNLESDENTNLTNRSIDIQELFVTGREYNNNLSADCNNTLTRN